MNKTIKETSHPVFGTGVTLTVGKTTATIFPKNGNVKDFVEAFNIVADTMGFTHEEKLVATKAAIDRIEKSETFKKMTEMFKNTDAAWVSEEPEECGCLGCCKERGELCVAVMDEEGAGGAHHHYQVLGFDTAGNKSDESKEPSDTLDIYFQNGPVKEVGHNGVTEITLLAIVADRLESFQSGPYACEENYDALEAVNDAIDALLARTANREKRGVEGTSKV